RSKGRHGNTARAGMQQRSEDDQAALAVPYTDRRTALHRVLIHVPTEHFLEVRDQYGDLSVLDTNDYLYGLKQGQEHVVRVETGVNLLVGLEAIGDVDDKGMRTVMATLNGQLRPVFVRDRSIKVDTKAAEKADATQPGHVAAPFSGVVTLEVGEGDSVEAGQAVATIEAMKMEAAITASVGGTVARLAVRATEQVEAGDLLVVVELN